MEIDGSTILKSSSVVDVVKGYLHLQVLKIIIVCKKYIAKC